MLRNILFSLLIISSTVVFSQEKANEFNICSVSKLVFEGNGKQKIVLLKKSYFNHLGLLVKEQKFSTGTLSEESFFYYKDTLLYRSEFLDFDKNRSTCFFLYDKKILHEKIEEPEKGVIIKTEYKYDKNANLICKLINEFYMGCSVSKSQLLTFYNSLGHKSEEQLINNNDTVCKTIFVYDDRNQLVKKTDFLKNRSLVNTDNFEYDSFGNLIKKTVLESDKLLRTEEYTYESNRIVSIVLKSKNGDIMSTENRVYNQLGLIKISKHNLKLNKKEIELYERGQIKEAEFWEDNKLSGKFIYTYTVSK